MGLDVSSCVAARDSVNVHVHVMSYFVHVACRCLVPIRFAPDIDQLYVHAASASARCMR